VAKRWNPALAWIERSIASEDERRTAMVTQGVDSPTYDRSHRRGVVRFGTAIVALYAEIVLVPDQFEMFAALLAVPTLFVTIRCGAFRDTAAARNYFAGWVDGRMALFERLTDEVPNGTEALLGALRLENERDLEVVLDVRTTQAPDDLSDLDDA